MSSFQYGVWSSGFCPFLRQSEDHFMAKTDHIPLIENDTSQAANLAGVSKAEGLTVALCHSGDKGRSTDSNDFPQSACNFSFTGGSVKVCDDASAHHCLKYRIMDAQFWNNRYAAPLFVYGETPNAFVAEMASQIPAGQVLCLAEGEGRNAVHLAILGHPATAVDQSETGLAKARRLAAARGVEIETVLADLEAFNIEPGIWSGIVATFAHLPPVIPRQVHAQVVRGLRPGGVFILEAYTPAQLAFDTGGPKSPELLMTLASLRDEIAGLEFLIGREIEREVIEGGGHTGRGAVVQVLARRHG